MSNQLTIDRTFLEEQGLAVPTTERERQEMIASLLSDTGYRWHFACEGGESFSAIAASIEGAYRVLDEERPGVRSHFLIYTCFPQWRRWRTQGPDYRKAVLRALGVGDA